MNEHAPNIYAAAKGEALRQYLHGEIDSASLALAWELVDVIRESDEGLA